MSKTPAKTQSSAGTVADQVAEFIGRSMGELLNRKDALSKQLAEVESQIAGVKDRVVEQFGEYLPPKTRTARAKRAVSRKVRAARKTVGAATKAARSISADTRAKMAEAARKRWARERTKRR